MKRFKAQTVKCIDRDMWVREIIDENGDLICELSFETTEKELCNKNEAFVLEALNAYSEKV